MTEYQNRILEEVPFYSGHPYLVPFIGSNYDNLAKHRKLLLVGESHYMPKDVTIHRDVDKWYDNPPEPERFDLTWCTPQKTCKDPYIGTFRTTITQELREVIGFESGDEVWAEIAFFNYFLRPSDEYGKALMPKPRDKKEAIESFTRVVNVLEPNVVVFVGAKAYDSAVAYREFQDVADGFKHTCVYAPSFGWWQRSMSSRYRDAKGKTAQEHFRAYLKAHWLLTR